MKKSENISVAVLTALYVNSSYSMEFLPSKILERLHQAKAEIKVEDSGRASEIKLKKTLEFLGILQDIRFTILAQIIVLIRKEFPEITLE
ncbi:MAG: hypothetical protein LBF44_00045, partial [Holosporaceae bacterium]|nr:hypothetical protein [Holosporaceae bacterium]